MPLPHLVGTVTRPLGGQWQEDVDKGKTEGQKGKSEEVREIVTTTVTASQNCNLLYLFATGGK